MLLLADQWKDYELIDMGNGEKLERWGNYVLRRPDPQVVWPMEAEWSLWKYSIKKTRSSSYVAYTK